jgi:hypothetical protein
MSSIRLTSPSRPALRVAQAQLRSVSMSERRSAKPSMQVMVLISLSALAIAFANLVLHILTSTAVYELADLQQQKKELTTTTQIIAEEVDSLASQQNLSNSAQKLGMIANANPVFLSIEEQKVYGKPTAALNTDGRMARNLIANSVMIEVSTDLNASVASSDVAPATNVANPKSSTGQVISNGGVIPASPTH